MLWACNSSTKEQQTISEEKFIQILIDIHLADASMTTQNIYSRRNDYKPSHYYNSIYQKHGISRTGFDSLINYYSQNNADFDRIYEIVIDSLNRLETQLKIQSKNAHLRKDTVNLWTGKNEWKFNKEEARDLKFNIPVKEKGFYTVYAEVKINKEDESLDPQIQAYFWKPNKTKEGESLQFEPIELIKDGKFHSYETKLEFTDSTFTHLRGNFLYRSNSDNEFNQNIEIRKIKIYNPQIQPKRKRRLPKELLQ